MCGSHRWSQRPWYHVRFMVVELVPKPAKPVSNVPVSPITVLKGCVEGHTGGGLSEGFNRRPRRPESCGGGLALTSQVLR